MHNPLIHFLYLNISSIDRRSTAIIEIESNTGNEKKDFESTSGQSNFVIIYQIELIIKLIMIANINKKLTLELIRLMLLINDFKYL